MRLEGSTFTGGRVEIDGNVFVGCVFDRTVLIYKGLAPVSMVECVFNNVEWAFDGPAANTLLFLKSIYHGIPDGGRQLVERIFEDIRRPLPPPQPAIAG